MRRLVHDRTAVGALVVTLVLGIELTVTASAVVDALLLRPWPVPEADRVVLGSRGVSPAAYRFLRDRAQTIDLAAILQACPVIRDVNGSVVPCEMVSGNYFEVLRLPVTVGRGLGPQDEVPGESARGVVIGFGFWQQRFNAAPDVVGRRLVFNGRAFTVVGVAPARTVRRFSSLPPQVWFPLASYDDLVDRGGPDFQTDRTACCVDLVGRLKASQADAADEVTALFGLFRPELAPRPRIAFRDTRPISGPWATSGPVLVSLLALSLLVVLGACCANAATIQVGRGLARADEFALMRALGASPWAIARPLALEAMFVAIVVLVGVIAIGAAGVSALEVYLTRQFGEAGFDLRPGVRVALVSLGVTALASMATGILPVLRGSTARSGSSTPRLFGWLVGIQMAGSTALVLVAALLWQGLTRASADIGADISGVARLVPVSDARPERLSAVRAQLGEALISVARADRTFAMADVGPPRRLFNVPTADGAVLSAVDVVSVTDGLFRLLSVPVREGRVLDASDAPTSVVINESLARQAWPGGGAVGRSLHADGPRHVVGVVGDFQVISARRAVAPTMYVNGSGGGMLLARNDAVTKGVIASVAASLDDSVRVVFQPLGESLDRSLQPVRAVTGFAAALAGVALGIASTGLFAAVSLTVRRRRHEMAVRIALGATMGWIARHLLESVGSRLAVGMSAGLLLGGLASPVLRALVPTVTAPDGAAVAVAGLVVLAAAALSALLPAARASGTPLAVTLKEE